MMPEWFHLLTSLKTSDKYYSLSLSLLGWKTTSTSNTSLFLLTQINLSFSSVTEVGLLSLASISCLQSMTILHLKRLTPSGLAAALLACGGLTKVKLQASFKSLLPKPLFEHLEARGCVFQWSEKLFQVCLTFICDIICLLFLFHYFLLPF